MGMSTTALMPVEEYLRLTEKPTSEYRDGTLYPKAMPSKFHGALEFQLVAMLRRLSLDAVAEVTVRLSPAKYLVPDVIAAPVLQSPQPYRTCPDLLRNPVPRRPSWHYACQVRRIPRVGSSFLLGR